MSELGSEAEAKRSGRRLPKIRGGIQPLPVELAPPRVAPLLEPEEPAHERSSLFESEAPSEVRSALFDEEELDTHLFVPLLDRPREDPTWPEGIPLEALSALDEFLPETLDEAPAVRITPVVLEFGATGDDIPPPLPESALGSSLLAELDFDVDEDETAAFFTVDAEGSEVASGVSTLSAAVSLLPAVEPPPSPAPAETTSGDFDVHGWFADQELQQSARATIEPTPQPVQEAVQPAATRRSSVVPALAAAILGGVIGFQAPPWLDRGEEPASAPVAPVVARQEAPAHSGLFSVQATDSTGTEAARVARPTLRLVAGTAQHLSGSVTSRGVAAETDRASGAALAERGTGGAGDPGETVETQAEEARSLRLSDFLWEGGAPPPKVVGGKIQRLSKRPRAPAPAAPVPAAAEPAGIVDLSVPGSRPPTLSEELAAATATMTPEQVQMEKSALTPEEVSRVVAGLKSSWRQCAQAQALRHPGVHGTLNLRWDILPDGTTASARVESTQWGNSPLARCVLARLATAQFPPSGQRISPVLLPLRF